MNKKRIAIIINWGISGGAGFEGNAWLTELCEELAKEHDLTVFMMVKANDQFQPKGYRLVDVPFHGKRSMVLRFSVLFFKIIQYHFKKKFQLFHGFWGFPAGFLTLLAGKLLGRKTLVTFIGSEVSNIPSIGYGLFQYRFIKKIIRVTAKNVDVVIAVSKHHAKKLQANIQFKRMEIIPFGIDLSKFPAHEKTLAAPFRFIYLGDINRVKNLPMLMKTFQKISKSTEARLDVMGEDTLNGEIQTLVKDMGLNDTVTFHGRQPNDQITFYLRKAHILLHTSLSETQAIAVNEALASGVAVCGTRVGIIEDLENEITTVVNVGDVDDLAEKALGLLKDPVKYEELRAKGIAWSKQNDLKAQAQKHALLYQSLMENI